MPLNINFQQIFLHAFNFIILFGILYFLLYNPVKKFMEKREEYYRDLDEQAKAKLSEADEIRKNYEERTANCQAEISAMMDKAASEASEKREEIVAQARQDAEKILEDARNKAVREREVIISDAKHEIEAIVSEVESRMISAVNVSDEYDSFLNTVDKKDQGDE